MPTMIKKLFDWTPRDIAYWEKIRQKGFGNFVAMYGIIVTGGLLFLIFGLLTLFFLLKQMRGVPPASINWLFIVGQLLFVALVCLVGGVINSLVTWVVEEKLYQKYKTHM